MGLGTVAEPLIELSASELRARSGKKWATYPADVYPAWVADMDYLTAEPVRQAIRNMADDANFCYSLAPLSVGDAFAERMHDRYAWEVRPDRTVLVADLVQAVTACLLAYSRPDDGVLVTSPTYPPLTNAITSTGRRIVDVALVEEHHGYVLDLQAVRETLARERVRVLLLCNPHNPTGRVLTRAELAGLAAAASDAGVTVVADEIHCDLVYPGFDHVPYATTHPGAPAQTVSLYSATKSFNLGGLRCGLLHFGSQRLLDIFHRTNPERLLGRVNSFGAVATIAAWRHGQPWMDSLMTRLRANRQRVADWAAQRPGVTMHEPEGTYFVWLNLADVVEPHEPAGEFLLREARVALSPGEEFGRQYAGSVRLNFATSTTILDEILARLDSAIGGRSPEVNPVLTEQIPEFGPDRR